MSWPSFFVASFLFQFARYLLLAGGIYLYFVRINKPLGRQLKIQPEPFSRAELRRELGYSFYSALVFVPLALPFHFSIRPHTKIYSDIEAYGFAWLALSFLILFVLYDTYFYWTHRLLHTPKLFRLIHSVHHRSINTSPFTAYSFHPIEALILFIWIVPLVFLIPINIYVLFSFTILSMIINVIGHSGFELYPKNWKHHPVLKYVNGSSFHNAHHLHVQGNYSLYISFWDILMKTKRPHFA